MSRPGVEGVELLSRDRGVEACRGLSRPVEACRGLSRLVPRLSVSRGVEGCRGVSRVSSVSSVSSGCRECCQGVLRLRCRGVQGGRMQLQPINKTWAAVAKLFHPLVAASQLHPVDVAQPEHNQYTLCGHLRTSSAGSHCHCAQRYCAGAAPQQRRRCSSVAPAAPPAHKAQLTTALMAQGWCHESVDIATAQGAVQQLRAASTPSQQRRRRCSVAVAAERRQCTKRNGPQVCTHGTSSLV